ncbi:hypothetical protein [Catenuloplanes atrovinosus]|uniref:Uncharacterized protein n=1 Tax=Catenuloplanes atrovinosus TaxID=137266 RepID=A0AAE3YPT1_9ACTN|nr:hypothetical protein [Catenuloplanes atrovinosus]MDR7276415.1 hypothetical protein [Catenuloplanes atrovinosus]
MNQLVMPMPARTMPAGRRDRGRGRVEARARGAALAAGAALAGTGRRTVPVAAEYPIIG